MFNIRRIAKGDICDFPVVEDRDRRTGDATGVSSGFLEVYGKDFSTIDAPASTQHRCLTEDIPYGLVPIVDLGQTFDIDMPVCRSIVDLGCAITGADLWASPYRLSHHSPLRKEFLSPAFQRAGAKS